MPSLMMQTMTGVRTLAYAFWDGQWLRSSRECPLAFDTETSLITDERQNPTAGVDSRRRWALAGRAVFQWCW